MGIGIGAYDRQRDLHKVELDLHNVELDLHNADIGLHKVPNFADIEITPPAPPRVVYICIYVYVGADQDTYHSLVHHPWWCNFFTEAKIDMQSIFSTILGIDSFFSSLTVDFLEISMLNISSLNSTLFKLFGFKVLGGGGRGIGPPP